MPSTLKICMLGVPQVLYNEQPLFVPRLQARALLYRLAFDLQPVTRAEISFLLWPDHSDAVARRSLTLLMSKLRTILPHPSFLQTTPDYICLDQEQVWSDTADFQTLSVGSALVTARRHQMIDLYRGPFLEGTLFPEAPEWENWQLRMRQHLEEHYLGALHGVLMDAVARRFYAEATEYARSYLKTDPLAEEVHRQLIEIYLALGKHSAARQQYEQCVALLDRELGVAPTPETYALFARLQQERETIPSDKPIAIQPVHHEVADVPLVPRFYGRTREYDDVKRWLLDDGYRLITILGMGGIGKSALVAHLSRQVGPSFDVVLWRSLLNAPPLNDVLQTWLYLLSRHEIEYLPNSLEERLHLLVEYLRQQRCLLVLDNYESILQAKEQEGDYQPGYEDYSQLLHQLVEQEHRSCLLLTSRERPPGVEDLERQSRLTRSYELTGLAGEAGRALLQDHGVHMAADRDETVVARYSGNPLALKVVADTIKELFGGDVSAFLDQEAPLFDDIRDVLNAQFNRLSELENDIVTWLAVEREPLSLQALEHNLVLPVSRGEILTALRALQRRSLLERIGTTGHIPRFTLQNVVMEYTTERLMATVYHEIQNGQVEVLNRYALLKAQAKEYVRHSQERILLQPLVRRIVARMGRVSAELTLKQILNRLRADTHRMPGYTAGNVLNLLLQLGCDLRKEDFSNLTVWHAYLQGKELQDVDFSHADLSGGAFTDSFGAIPALAFSPDGEYLASATGGGEVRIWSLTQDRSALKPYLACVGHMSLVWSVCFTADGHVLASGGEDLSVRLWDVQTGQCLRILLGHSAWIRSVSFSPDGRFLASGSDDHSVRLWDAQTGQCIRTLQGHTTGVWSVSFSADGRFLVSGSGDQTCRIWDVHTGDCIRILQAHSAWVRAVCCSPNSPIVATGSGDHSVRLWDMQTGTCLHILRGHTYPVASTCFSHDGSILASSSQDNSIRLWDVQTGRCLRILQGHTNAVWSVCFRSDDRILASGSADQSVRLWDAQTGECIHTLQGHTNAIWSICFDTFGEKLASGNEDNRVRIWDVQSGECLRTLSGHLSSVWSVCFSPDGRQLASASGDQSIRVWDVETGECLQILQGHSSWVRSIHFSVDGYLLASCGVDQSIRLWDVRTGQCIDVLHGHASSVWSVCFSPDGKRIASSSEDQSVRLWNVQTGQKYLILEGHTSSVWSVCFSPNGRFLASASGDRTIRLWDAQTGKCLNILRGHISAVRSVCFSPDGQRLVSGGEDRTVRFWDSKTGRCLHVLNRHSSVVRSVQFSPSDRIAASSSHDQSIRMWNVETGESVGILRVDRPYERMNITGTTGLTPAQKESLKALGAVEGQPSPV